MFRPPSFSVYVCASLAVFYAVAASAQEPASLSVGEILRRADAQRKVYLTEFKNLLSQETKSFESFNKNGEIKKRRTIKSTFIIYQLSANENVVAEFRNVFEVDGKTLEKTEHRAQDFFEKIEKTESLGNELNRLRRESLRYDIDIVINGFTLFRSVTLEERLWPYFEYKLEGKTTVNGADAFVISFQQTRECPFISVNPKARFAGVQRSLTYSIHLNDEVDYAERLSGKLIIDAATFQVWREERVMTLQPDGFERRVPLDENIFEFQKSDFGIFTPKRIEHTQYDLSQKDKTSKKSVRVILDYEKFTKADVVVNVVDVKLDPKPF